MRISSFPISIINTNTISSRYRRIDHRLRMAMQGTKHVLATLLFMHDRARQRRVLARLDTHQLSDIGCSRADAQAEAAKPFWSN
jgi:uncharacterized protein YjiS (DUF1127 family)